MASWTVEVRADPADGEPVVAGIVELAREDLPREIHSSETDAVGRARVEIPGPGAYTISLTKNVEGGVIVGDLRAEVVEDGQVFAIPTRAVR